ncbi:MAG: hypothetical protein HY712_07785 [candidate division NC10 bacterium]|nr:hypothetical protein [candidate division NC10 bacterium]
MCASGIARRRRERGAALIISMLIMAVLLLAGTTFLTISSTESQIALNETSLNRAFHEAETVLNQTIVILNGNSSYTGTTGTTSTGASYTVSVTAAADQPCPTADARTIAVRASVNVRGGQAPVDLSATVDRIAYPFRFAAFALGPDTGGRELRYDLNAYTDSFDSGLGGYNAALSQYTTSTNRSAFGSAGANADVYFENTNSIYGDLRAGDTITNESRVTMMQGGVKVKRLLTANPSVDSPGGQFPSITPPTTPTSALSVPANTTTTLNAGFYYYTTMSIGSNGRLQVNGPATLYFTGGPTSFGNNVIWGNAANPTYLKVVLKSTGGSTEYVAVNAGNQFTLYGSLYGQNTNIDLGQSSVVYGSVIGRTVRLDKDSVVHYDQALALEPICRGVGEPYQVRKGSWREVLPSW